MSAAFRARPIAPPDIVIVSQAIDDVGSLRIKATFLGMPLPEISYTADQLATMRDDELQAGFESGALEAIEDALRDT